MNYSNGIKADVHLTLVQHNTSYYLDYDQEIVEKLNQPMVYVKVSHPIGWERIYPIFQQNAMIYDDYSTYMKMHGCACCSLTSILAAMRRSKSRFMPQDTIVEAEKNLLPRWEYDKNYDRPVEKQMPVTLYGICQILQKEAISCKYVASFQRKEAMEILDRHLRSGNPVIFELSRIRYKGNIPVSINDRKYAGSYHTMIMLGYDKEGKVIITDSAQREWAGSWQRLKRADLSDLMNYMFPQKNTESTPCYFHKRKNTGGFLLVHVWDRIENIIQKKIGNSSALP